MSNYKRKKSREKKHIEYGTPKQIQQIQEGSEVRLHKAKRNKVCKYYKGAHVFEEVGRKYYEWIDETFIDLKCKCGKRDIKTVKGQAFKK
jgi:hypothetical protein